MTDTLHVTIERMAQGGAGVARHEGQVVFVAGALPGEQVRVQIEQAAASYLRGQVVEVLQAAPERVAPRLPQGGDHLSWQHIAYPAQLAFKQRILREQLQKLARIAEPPVLPMLPAPQPWHYRNTARLHLAGATPDTLQIGYHAAGTQQVVDLYEDPLLLPALNEALWGLRVALEQVLEQEEPLPSQILLRGSAAGGYAVAAMLDAPRITRVHRRAVARWQHYVPALAGVSLDPDDEEEAPVRLHEALGGITFVLSPFSFFQTHTAQAEAVLAVLRRMIDMPTMLTLLDAYSGVGAFALPLAQAVQQVVAIELYPQAVADGRANAMLNDIDNVRFVAAPVEEVLPTMRERVDVAILDPPRRGCDARVLAALVARKPRRIAYVSCHPGILARDLAVLLAGGFRLIEVQPVDMFPQTPHIECIALLEA